MLIIRFVSGFSVLRVTAGVLLAGEELNARPWPELLHKAGLALLQYRVGIQSALSSGLPPEYTRK